MHNFFAGIMGFFVGMGAFFHHGQGLPAQTNQTQTSQQAAVSGTPPQQGMMGRGRGMMNWQNGQRPFFGTVTSVNGNTLTVEMRMPMMRFNYPSVTPSITPGATQTVTVKLDSSTKYDGGSQSDIKTNTKIAGIGKLNSDNSITATEIRINATLPNPSGFRHGMMNRADRDNDGDDN